MRKILSTTLATAMLAVSTIGVNAAMNQFYTNTVGQWTVEGFYGDKNFCTAKTFWDNGSYMSLFNVKNSDEISLFVHNIEWNIGDASGTDPAYMGTIHFSGKYSPTKGTIAYELVDSQTAIFRNVNEQFLKDWVSYEAMEVVMPGDIGRIKIGLDGTKIILDSFADCIAKLNATSL